MQIDKTVKKETIYIAVWGAVFSLLMQSVFLIISQWGFSVLFGNLWGYAAATGNFLLLGLTVQKAVTKTEEEAKKLIKLSHTLRNMMILIVAVIGIVIPFLNTWAVIIPLFFPRIAIFFRGFSKNK